MNLWLLLIGGVFLSFGLVILIGAPYLPTQRQQINQALKLMEPLDGKQIAELGAGSGGVALAMAKQGAHVDAYEINPLLAGIIYVRAKAQKLPVRVIVKSFWRANLDDYDGLYIFQMDKDFEKLSKKLNTELKQGSFVVTYAYKLPRKKVNQTNGPMYKYVY